MKHLLITGAGRGIGRHLLETFAPTVERVAIFDIDEVGGREAQNMFPIATFYIQKPCLQCRTPLPLGSQHD